MNALIKIQTSAASQTRKFILPAKTFRLPLQNSGHQIFLSNLTSKLSSVARTELRFWFLTAIAKIMDTQATDRPLAVVLLQKSLDENIQNKKREKWLIIANGSTKKKKQKTTNTTTII